MINSVNMRRLNDNGNKWNLGSIQEPPGRLKVESTRVSLDDLNDKMRKAKAQDRIKDSVNGLHSWNKGVSDLMSTWEDDNFQFDKLF